ncbi:hypothetical protein ACFCYX_32920 [Streptomyces populi]|nr:hypothetical protein [Streptomyces populi]
MKLRIVPDIGRNVMFDDPNAFARVGNARKPAGAGYSGLVTTLRC